MQSTATETIPEIIQESNAETQFNGILPADYAAKIVCILSQQVDRLFEDAALKLNLRALCLFLHAACKASKDQLFKSVDGSQENRKLWWRRSKPREEELNVLLLSRLGEVSFLNFNVSLRRGVKCIVDEEFRLERFFNKF